MATVADRELYDVMTAARRVGRDRVTIYLWMRQGMPWRQIGAHRYIAHDDLLALYRQQLKSLRQHRARRVAGRWQPR